MLDIHANIIRLGYKRFLIEYAKITDLLHQDQADLQQYKGESHLSPYASALSESTDYTVNKSHTTPAYSSNKRWNACVTT